MGVMVYISGAVFKGGARTVGKAVLPHQRAGARHHHLATLQSGDLHGESIDTYLAVVYHHVSLGACCWWVRLTSGLLATVVGNTVWWSGSP